VEQRVPATVKGAICFIRNIREILASQRFHPANAKWAYEDPTHSDRNADPDHWRGIARIPIRYAAADKEGF
jgi:hypothetical protein